MPDTSLVKIYKQLGASPNPATDTLLGVDTTVESGAWGVGVGLGVGRHKIYAVAIDLAGNQSVASAIYNISRLPSPMYVSETVDWFVGELYNTYLGEIG